MNYIFISPNFPYCYSNFVVELNRLGVNVLGIMDTNDLSDILRNNLKEYYYVSDMKNYDEMKKAVKYFQEKYGKIDVLESHNEFWLYQDARLREEFNIEGLTTKELDILKYKSKMKELFIKSGVKTAKYILPKNKEEIVKFANEVGYPIFIKPDNGVGAEMSFKINNEEDIDNKIQILGNLQGYIVEEFIEGDLISFDGIADENGKVVLSVNEVFPNQIADIVNNAEDLYYYCKKDIDPKFKRIGPKCVKSFDVKERFFHFEFFVKKDGSIYGLELNDRPPGGETLQLIAESQNISPYKIYAYLVTNNLPKLKIDKKRKKYYATEVARRDRFHYHNDIHQIIEKYKNNIIENGRYSYDVARAMGDEYLIAKFEDEEEMLVFAKLILQK